MTEIRRQIASARRRLLVQSFLDRLAWLLAGGLLLATVALAVTKFVALPPWTGESAALTWTTAWVAGGVAMAVVMALVWTYVTRRPVVETAIEIDRRYRLRERVSSATALSESERDSAVGQAVVADAERSVAGIDISEGFPVRVQWPAAIPVIVAVVLVGLAFVPNAEPGSSTPEGLAVASVQQKLKEPTEQLRRRIEQARAQAEERGLKDSEVFLKELRSGVDKLTSKDAAEKKDALIDLNQLKKSLEDRQKQLADPAEIKKQLKQLDGADQGPAEAMNKALAKGDFEAASKQLDNLKDRLTRGDLTPEEQKALAEQAEKMADKLADMAGEHDRMKQDLERQIEQMKRAGNNEGAADLQKKLDQLLRNDAAMENMRQMAQKLQQASESLAQGDQQAAADQLAQMQDQMQQMSDQLEEGMSLDQIADQLSECKDCLGDKPGEGQGMDGPPQFAGGMGQGNGIGDGLGEGQGQGDRPEERGDTGSYDSQVRGQPKPGEAVRTGDAFGSNSKGQAIESARETIESASTADEDPLTQQRLPRGARDHVREYMLKVGTGQ